MSHADELLTLTLTRRQWWEITQSMSMAAMEFGESQPASEIQDAIHQLLGETYEEFLARKAIG